MPFRPLFNLRPAAMLAAVFGLATGCAGHPPEGSAGAAPAPTADYAAVAAGTTHPVYAGTTAEAAAEAPVATTAPVTAARDTQYLKFDPATKTVTFRLSAGPFDFNGFTSGGGTLTVPPGSINVWNFVQDDGTPHSAEVSAGSGPIPNSGGDPAIPRAYTNKVVEGLVQGATDVIRFTAPDSGTYRIICGVPGHALSGMWIWFKVDPAATAPSFGPTPK